MSYGLYINTCTTLLDVKKALAQHSSLETEILSSGELCVFKDEGLSTFGSVTFGFVTEDDEIIHAMCIRGRGEDFIRPILKEIDPDAVVCDEAEI